MDKLALLEELEVMIITGEISLAEGNAEGVLLLRQIRNIVERSLQAEILQDITDFQTSYYAPEHDSWQDFLSDCNGYSDYERVLRGFFTNEELEELWQNSHIPENLSQDEIRREIYNCIGSHKMLQIVEKLNKPSQVIIDGTNVNNQQPDSRSAKWLLEARIRGLYNLLYEKE